MRSSVILSLFLTISIFLNGQTKLPYIVTFDNVAQQSEWKQYRAGTAKPVHFLWDFEKTNAIGDSFALSHYYPVGGSQTTDDWMVSPELDMSNGGIIDSIYHLMVGFGTPQAADTIAIYYLEGSRDPSLATKKEIVYDFLRTNFKIDNTWYSKSALKIPHKSSTGYLAFRYKTVVNWLDIKLDNIQISPQKTSTVQPIDNDIIVNVFPNPSSGVIKFKTDFRDEIDVSILDLSGKLIIRKTVNTDSEIHIEHLPKGIYFVEVSAQNKIQKTKLILK